MEIKTTTNKSPKLFWSAPQFLEVEHETAKAILFSCERAGYLDNGRREFWVPKSYAVHYDVDGLDQWGIQRRFVFSNRLQFIG